MTKLTNLLLLTFLVLATSGLVLAAKSKTKKPKPCKVPVPFSEKLIGRTFMKLSECYRPNLFSSVRIFKKRFIFKPTYVSKTFFDECEEQYHFYFRREKPFIIHRPTLEAPKQITGSGELDRFCKKEHPKTGVRLDLVGKTRKKFKRAVRRMVKGILEIRDFGCTEDEDGFPRQIKGRAFTNADVDGIATYLLGVAYQFKFCAQPK